MTTLTKEQINEIADQLDFGFRCFWHRYNHDLVFIPDTIRNPGMETEFFEEEIEKIDNDCNNYVEIQPLDSSDSFEIMADFAYQLRDNIQLTSELTSALARRKPFREFKFVIDNSGEYRQKWFDYKNQRLREWVEEKFKEATRN